LALNLTHDEIDAIATMRDELNKKSKKRMVMSPDYERVGVVGEIALRDFFGIRTPPRGDLLGGDKGIDVTVGILNDAKHWQLMTIDVKTAANYPHSLWVEKDKVVANIYVLAHAYEQYKARLLKWMWGFRVERAPLTFEKKINHTMKREECFDMALLRERYAPQIHDCWCGQCGIYGEKGMYFCSEHRPQPRLL